MYVQTRFFGIKKPRKATKATKIFVFQCFNLASYIALFSFLSRMVDFILGANMLSITMLDTNK